MKQKFLICFLLYLSYNIKAQEKSLISSTGMSINHQGLIINVAIGEVVIGTSFDSNYHFCNGFLPHERSVPTIVSSDNDNSLKVYPNPVEDIILIQGIEITSLLEIRIYNMAGKLIDTIEADTNSVSLAHLKSGEYLLILQSGSKSYNAKILKK